MRVWDRIAGALEEHGRCVLVSIVQAKGSVPREPGARLVVVPGGGFFGTIGGGTLEWQALAQAQSDLEAEAPAVRLRDFALGPALGQCCGGSATLAFEVLDAHTLEGARDFARRERDGRFRTVGRIAADAVERSPEDGPAPEPGSAALADGCLIELFGDAHRPVLLFGAGHVGRALMLALAPLPFRLTWVDSRPDAFPLLLPEAVERVLSNQPAVLLDEAPEGAFVIVMTHSHALDLELVDAALRRPDLGYLGLIGSATKRARFEMRLLEAGLSAGRLSALTCPIGVPGIGSKEPAAIAAAVAAELLIRDDELRRGRNEPEAIQAGAAMMEQGR